MSNSSKLSLFRTLKCTYAYYKYLSYFKEKSFRAIIMKVRCSNQLAIETGRHGSTIIPREDIICRYCLTNCNSYIVEDEYHFIIKCPLYTIYI